MMKRLALCSFLPVLAASLASAQTAPKTVSIILPSVVRAVEADNVEQSDTGCNPSGSNVYGELTLKVGLVRNSDGILKGMLSHVSDQMVALNADNSHCGDSCQEVNVVSTVTATVPNSWSSAKSCNSVTPAIIQKNFRNARDLQSYVNDTLYAKNEEGKRLDAACQAPCAYHVASSITPQADKTQRLNLSVLCGPPRSGSLLFSRYFFSAGLIQQWSCKKR